MMNPAMSLVSQGTHRASVPFAISTVHPWCLDPEETDIEIAAADFFLGYNICLIVIVDS